MLGLEAGVRMERPQAGRWHPPPLRYRNAMHRVRAMPQGAVMLRCAPCLI